MKSVYWGPHGGQHRTNRLSEELCLWLHILMRSPACEISGITVSQCLLGTPKHVENLGNLQESLRPWECSVITLPLLSGPATLTTCSHRSMQT